MSNSKWKNSNAIAILRVSSIKQQENSSHETQESEVQNYCTKNNLKLIKIFKIVESAKNSEDRIKYREAINFALKNKIQHCLYTMPDRESRNLKDIEETENHVRAGAIVLHYVRENRILDLYSSDSDFLTRDMSAIVNKQFIRNLRTKVNDGMKFKAEQGWYPSNRPPLGYITRREVDCNGKEISNSISTIMLDPNQNNRMQVLREFELRRDGLALNQIRKQIIDEGFINYNKISNYHVSSIEKRLKNKFYSGRFDWQGVEYIGKHELFIPKELFQSVQASFGIKGNYRPKNGIFAGGWIRCAVEECGCFISYDPKVKKNRQTGIEKHYHYYRCANGKKIHSKNQSISEDKIWEFFEKAVGEIEINEEFAGKVAAALNSSTRSSRERIKKRLEDLQKALDKIVKLESEAYLDLKKGLLDEEGFKSNGLLG